MEHLALYACEFACTAVPAFIVYLALGPLIRARTNNSAPSAVLASIFIIYLFALLHFTGAGTLHDALRFGLDFNPCQINVIPFANFTEDVEGHLLNVLLFVPLSLLVPMSSGGYLKALPVVATAIVTSLTIEFSQLLNSRVTDIDDLLMNVIGALIGYAIFRILFRRRCDDGRPSVLVMASMLVAAFLGRFLLFDEMGLAKMLFGF